MTAAKHRRMGAVHGQLSAWMALFFGLSLALGCHSRVPLGPSPSELAWQRAHELESSGQLEAAAKGYGALCHGEPRWARGCLDEVMVWFELGRVDKARAAAGDFVRAFPEDSGVASVVRRLARSYGDDVEAAAAHLFELASAVAKAEAFDTITYELASIWRRAQRPLDEAAALERIVQGHTRWTSQLWDDAVWRLSQLARSGEDPQAEESYLKVLIDTQEQSRLIGSYSSPYHDDALLRLAQLRHLAGDLKGALAALAALQGIPTSRLRDEGYILEAMYLWQAGQKPQACTVLHGLNKRWPDSSEFPRAQGLLREWGCALAQEQ